MKKKIVSMVLVALLVVMLVPAVASALTMTEVMEGKVITFYVGEEVNVFDALMAADARLGHLRNDWCFQDLALDYVGDSADYYTISGEVITGIKQGSVQIKITGTASCGAEDIYEDPVDSVFSVIVKYSAPNKPVTDVQVELPSEIIAGTDLPLTALIEPADASMQDAVFAVKDAGATGAQIVDGKLVTTGAGTVVLTVTIPGGAADGSDFVKEITVTVAEATPSPEPSVSVSPSATPSPSPTSKVVKTGDMTAMLLYAMVIVLMSGAVVAILRQKKRLEK